MGSAGDFGETTQLNRKASRLPNASNKNTAGSVKLQDTFQNKSIEYSENNPEPPSMK